MSLNLCGILYYMAVNCPKCGLEVEDGKKFCTMCGAAVAPGAGQAHPPSPGKGAQPDAADEGRTSEAAKAKGLPSTEKPSAALPRYWEPDPDSKFQPSSSP